MDTVCLGDKNTALLSHRILLPIWFMWQSRLQLPPRLVARRNATQGKSTPPAFERQEPSIAVSVLMYSVSSQLKACCARVWLVCVRVSVVRTGMGGLELVIHQSCPSHIPLSLALTLSFSLCLIAWAWGRVLIMFYFIQTINPEAQCTRVPPSGDVTHLAKTVPLSSLSLWVTGAPFFPSFFNPWCT